MAIPQAGIAAPTLTVMQGFQAKKIAQCISFPVPAYFVYTPYQSWSLGQNLQDRDETLTLRDRDETETLSKNSRRDRGLNVARPR